MTEKIIIIPGIPIAKKRPRFASRDRLGRPLPFVKTVNIQQTEEGRFLWELKDQWREPLIEGPITLKTTFVMPIVKSTSKKARIQIKEGILKHTKKPDLDNLVKFCKDCLNGTVWRDDSQVWFLIADKQYGEVPRTIISIEGK